jgi:heavy metal sensor kinase
MAWPQIKKLRWRLTLWYGSTFAIVLLVHIGLATFLHYRQLLQQFNHAEIQELKTAEGLLYQTADGQVRIRDDYFNHPQLRLSLDRLLQVMRPDGAILYQNHRLHGTPLGGAPLAREGVNSYRHTMVRLSDGRIVIMVSHVHVMNGMPVLIRLGYDMEPLYASVARFIFWLLLLAPFSILVTGYAVYRATSGALRPLSLMTQRARQINAEKLNQRLPVIDAEDDLGQLSIEFNQLLARLDDAFTQLKRFTSDASHELRTPLASLRSIGEVGLQTKKTGQEYRDIVASMLEEVSRLTSLVDSLLVIARSDSGMIHPEKSVVSYLAMMQEVQELVGILAEEKQQSIEIAGDASLRICVDRGLLRQVLINVLENAIKYSPAGTRIRIDLQRLPEDVVELCVHDQGPGIPEEEKTRIFDRFRRIDDGRSRERGGAGLGLSIAKWATEINGGTIGVRDEPEQGSCFYVAFPEVITAKNV